MLYVLLNIENCLFKNFVYKKKPILQHLQNTFDVKTQKLHRQFIKSTTDVQLLNRDFL